MESLKSAFRLFVMLAVVGIGYKVWQLYGPPAAQVKALALRGLAVARAALESDGSSDKGNSSLTADPRPMSPTLAAPAGSSGSDANTPGSPMIPQPLGRATLAPEAASLAAPELAPAPSKLPSAAAAPDPPPAASVSAAEQAGDNYLQDLSSQLENLGARDVRIAPWGTAGQLCRCSCRVLMPGFENFQQHFEAVDSDPRAAVEAVAAKLAAWRVAQRDLGQPNTELR